MIRHMKRAFILATLAIALFTSCNPELREPQGSGKGTKLHLEAGLSGNVFKLKNQDTFFYNNLDILLNGKYSYKQNFLPAGDSITVYMGEFVDQEGNRFKDDMKGQEMEITTTLPDGKKGYFNGAF